MTSTGTGSGIDPGSPRLDGLDRARAIADAVLYEGYLLYPYRASSSKNQVRWQFGVVGPQGAYEAGSGEDADMRTECLLVPAAPTGPARSPTTTAPRLDLRLRFLRLQKRSVDQLLGDEFVPVPELRCGDSTWLAWDEAVEASVDVSDLALEQLVFQPRTVSVEIPGGEDVEALVDGSGVVIGRLRRHRRAVRGSIEVSCRPVTGPHAPDAPTGSVILQVQLHNSGGWTAGGDRDQALAQSFLGAHFVLAVRDAGFVSLLEPPPWAEEAAAACDNHRCWPVLVGGEGSGGASDTVLASPIILYDWPQIAADSAGELFDSTEIDEILTLRVMTMTDEEKRQARATDPRAGAIVDRCDAMTAEGLARLHGGNHEVSPPTFTTGDVPWWDPEVDSSVSPATDSVDVQGIAVAKGSAVRLRPSRRADAQDIFFTGQTARVAGVHHDVDGNVHIAVVLDDDPAADLHEWYGRYLYFAPDEVEPVGPSG